MEAYIETDNASNRRTEAYIETDSTSTQSTGET